jgi:uncharacterized protein YbjT (DUF2867 family)
MTVILFGATGMVGIEVLHRCLEDRRVGRVLTVVRRSTGVSHPKLEELLHENFEDYSPLHESFRAAHLCLYCIGVYQGTVPEETYRKVTCDYLEALVRKLERVNPQITFCLNSAQGTDRTEKSRVLFARAKGHAENVLFDAGLKDAYAFRPGFINPGRISAKSRIPVWFARPFYRLIPALGIDAADLAAVMLETGLKGSERKIFENADLRRAARELKEEEVNRAR